MNILVILVVAVGLLFATTYFTRRRFGVLGLALCAGFLLSTMWTDEVTPFVRDSVGIELLTPPLSSVVAASLVLLPAILLLFSGPAYHKKSQRLIGSAAFALLAVSFLLTPLGNSINFDNASKTVYSVLNDNRNLIITAAVSYALYDLMTFKTPKKEK